MLSFFDMKRFSGLQAFEWLLAGVMITLGLATVASPAGLALGRGDVVLDATVARPYAVLFPGGRSIDVAEGGRVTRHDFGEGDRRSIEAPPSVQVKAEVDRHDVDTRLVLGAGILVGLVVAWAGVLSLWLLVHSARAGHPFVPANVRRLRIVAAAAIALPVVARLTTWVVDGTPDADVDLRVSSWGPDPWTCVLVGVGLLALAQVFRAGVELRELEQGTI
jgi:hypothetical protein